METFIRHSGKNKINQVHDFHLWLSSIANSVEDMDCSSFIHRQDHSLQAITVPVKSNCNSTSGLAPLDDTISASTLGYFCQMHHQRERDPGSLGVLWNTPFPENSICELLRVPCNQVAACLPAWGHGWPGDGRLGWPRLQNLLLEVEKSNGDI